MDAEFLKLLKKKGKITFKERDVETHLPLPNSRPMQPTDVSSFETPALLLKLTGTTAIGGKFRGINWLIEPKHRIFWDVTFDGLVKQRARVRSLAEAFQTVYVTGIRLGKDDE